MTMEDGGSRRVDGAGRAADLGERDDARSCDVARRAGHPDGDAVRQRRFPQIGPVPSLRPTISAAVDEEQQHQQVAELTASAYVSRHATVTPAAFEQVLDGEKLTPETIVRAWNHGLVAAN